MRIARFRIVLPARSKRDATSEARLIAATVAETLGAYPDVRGPLRVDIDGLGRPAGLMAQDLALASGRAARSKRREG